MQRDTGGERMRERERDFLLAGSLYKWTRWRGLGEAEASSLVLYLAFHVGSRDLSARPVVCCFSRHIFR